MGIIRVKIKLNDFIQANLLDDYYTLLGVMCENNQTYRIHILYSYEKNIDFELNKQKKNEKKYDNVIFIYDVAPRYSKANIVIDTDEDVVGKLKFLYDKDDFNKLSIVANNSLSFIKALLNHIKP